MSQFFDASRPLAAFGQEALHTYATQVETLLRLRHGASQVVRVDTFM